VSATNTETIAAFIRATYAKITDIFVEKIIYGESSV